MKLSRQIILLLIVAAVLPISAVFISLTIYANRQREALVSMRLNDTYSGAVNSYEKIGGSILTQMEQLSQDPALIRYLLVKDQLGYIDQQGLIDYTTDMRRLLNLDYLAIIAPDGAVLARGHDPGMFGDRVSDDPVFAEALRGQKVKSLDKVSLGNEEMLTSVALTPVWYENRQMVAVLAGGKAIDDEFCRNLQALSGAEVLLLEGDQLLAKTFPGNFNEISLYLQDSQTFRTKIQGLWYSFARYPLKNISGDKIADLLMGVTTHDLDLVFYNMRIIYGVFALGGLLLAIIFGYLSGRSFTRPLDSLAQSADRLASGDFSARVRYTGPSGEMANLIDTFNEMAANLEDYRRKLIESERLAAFSLMARKVAHEIKNPLTPIKIAIQDLRRAYDASDPQFDEAFRQSTRTVLEEVESLTKIVEEFSQFAKFPSPKLQPNDLNDIVNTAIPLFSDALKSGKLCLELSGRPIPVIADQEQVKRALINLIKNGLEAIPQAGRVTVRTSERDRSAIATVTDNGPGLSPTARQNLFTPYFTTKPGGSGLGLVIVKKIISEHDGKISITTGPDGGTEATIVLPIRPAR